MNWKINLAAGAILFSGTLYAQAPDGMTAYWKFDEGTGDIAHDSINENHGDIFGAVWTNGRVGDALLFDGSTNDYVEGAYESGWSYRIGTVEGWIKLDSYPTRYRYGVIAIAVSGQNTCNFTDIVEIEPSGKLAFYLWDRHVIRPVGNTVLNLNDWYHVAVTVDIGDSGLYLKLYLNGNLEASVPATYHYRDRKFVFGRFGSCWSSTWSHDPFHGVLDEVAIYTRALTVDEIQQHYQDGLNGIGYFGDTDGDGIPYEDDLCPDTVIPEAVPTTLVLNPNHWALTDDDDPFDFDTVIKGKSKGPNRSYTIEDTAGCSCEQIIEANGLGDGHTKFGCSISAMDDWVEFVNQ